MAIGIVITNAATMPISGIGPNSSVPPTIGTQSGRPITGWSSPRMTMITAGSTMNSPWAKLIAPAVCQSKAKPTAARAKIAPVARPENVI